MDAPKANNPSDQSNKSTPPPIPDKEVRTTPPPPPGILGLTPDPNKLVTLEEYQKYRIANRN